MSSAPASMQQLLDDHLGHRVLALAEVVEADPSLAVGEVHRRPEVVRERLPDPVVAVDRDGILDAEVARVRDDVVEVPLEAELRGVHADDGQAGVRVLRGPGPDIRQGPDPVDAGVGPEVDEDDPTAESFGRQRLGVEPAGRTVEGRQVPLDREDVRVSDQAVGESTEKAWTARRGGRRVAARPIGHVPLIDHGCASEWLDFGRPAPRAGRRLLG